MNTFNKIFGIALLATSLAACGNSNTNPYANTYSPYGNGSNYNTYGNGTGVGGPGGCVPIQSGALAFTAQGAAISNTSIYAGNLPMNSTRPGQFGQVIMGQAGATGGAGMIQYAPKQNQNGTLQLTSSGAMGQGTISGQIQLSPTVVAQLMGMAANYGVYNNYPQNGTYQNQMAPLQGGCISSVALDIIHTVVQSTFNPYNYGYTSPYNSPYGYNQGMMGGMGQINQALVYLYLNGGQPVGPILF